MTRRTNYLPDDPRGRYKQMLPLPSCSDIPTLSPRFLGQH